MYRYWNGSQWSETLSATPGAPPPKESLTMGPAAQRRTGSKSRLPWLIVAGVAVVALIVVGIIVVPKLPGVGRPGVDPLPPGYESTNPCPPDPTGIPTMPAQPGDGRVHGGPISYPQLPEPWRAPQGDFRVPFGRDVIQQTVLVEENYNGRGESWVASILVAQLMAGDGFFSPEEGAAIVARCVAGRFYGDAVVDRDDQVDKAITVDGHEAWLIESHLSFDIEGLETKGELMIIAVIKVDDFKSGLFYASIPDTVPNLVEPARQALAAVKVDGG